jgi:aryl-alcohol dehydrogenase-like predicted oxidoreductase
MLKKAKLGRTGLEVTQLGFGAMELRGPKVWSGRPISDEQAERILHAVLDAGINFIDTSVDYGLSEERIGRFISSRRKEYYLATKCGCDPHEVGDKWETPHTWTRDNILRNIEGSLKRMKTDYVDVLQFHNPKPQDVASEKLVDVLKDIQRRGLTKFIGISTTLPDLPVYVEMGVFDTFQIPYSVLDPKHHDAISLAAKAGAGTIIRGGIAKGGPESDVAAASRVEAWKKAGLEELLDGMSPAEMILRATLSHPDCHTTIIGTLNVEHIKANVAAAAKGPLPAKLYEEIRRRVARFGKTE